MYVTHTASDTALVITNYNFYGVYRSLYRFLLSVFLSKQAIYKEKKDNAFC